MAALTISNVTINERWTEGNTNGRKFRCIEADVVFSANGNTVGDCPATVFFLNKIYDVDEMRRNDNSSSGNHFALPLFDHSGFITNVALTGTFRLIIKGK